MQNNQICSITNQKTDKIDIQQSQGLVLNQNQLDIFGRIRSVSSDGSLYRGLFGKSQRICSKDANLEENKNKITAGQDDYRNRSVVISIPTRVLIAPKDALQPNFKQNNCAKDNSYNKELNNNVINNNLENRQRNASVHRSQKIKKNQKKNSADYKKNICGYITKKVLRQFTGEIYKRRVEQLCQLYQCSYNQVKSYYYSKIQHVTGPSHIPGLLCPTKILQPNQSHLLSTFEQQKRVKSVFRQFFKWFLKQRYIRYLILQGKMSHKDAYIQYKNGILLSIIQESDGGDEETLGKLRRRISKETKFAGNQHVKIPKFKRRIWSHLHRSSSANQKGFINNKIQEDNQQMSFKFKQQQIQNIGREQEQQDCLSQQKQQIKKTKVSMPIISIPRIATADARIGGRKQEDA